MLEQYIPTHLSKEEFRKTVQTLFPLPEQMATISALTNALVLIDARLDLRDEKIFTLKVHTASVLFKLVAALNEAQQVQTINELASIGLPFLEGETKPDNAIAH